MANRIAILLAPVPLSYDPSSWPQLLLRPNVKPVPWRDGRYNMRPLLGDAHSIEISTDQLQEVADILAKSQAGSLVTDGHSCILFGAGVAILKIDLHVFDVRRLLRVWPDALEEKLAAALAAVGVAICAAHCNLSDKAQIRATEADWVYFLTDTEEYVDTDYASDELEEAHYHQAPSDSRPMPTLNLADRPDTRIWIDWNAAQLSTIAGLSGEGLTLDGIVRVFVIRSACWKLLTTCGDAALSVLAFNEDSSSDLDTVVASLRNIQVFAARLIASYHSALWTADHQLVQIFSHVDAAWSVDAHLGRTRELLDSVGSILSAQHAAAQDARDRKLEQRDRGLAVAALSLAALSLVSAIADMIPLIDGMQRGGWKAYLAVAVPIGFVIIALSGARCLYKVSTYRARNRTRRRRAEATRPVAGSARDGVIGETKHGPESASA